MAIVMLYIITLRPFKYLKKMGTLQRSNLMSHQTIRTKFCPEFAVLQSVMS
jgi:hypothetical protein